MAAPPRSAFGLMLRRHRLAAALSQETLADRAGLSTRGVSDLERGARTAPRPETVRLLADALELGPADRASFVAAARPALSSTPLPGGNAGRMSRLPQQLTALVGRERDVLVIGGALRNPDVRLLTLTGPGGVGKTRLALAVAATVEPEFSDGAVFVPLAAITEPDLVIATVARSIGVRDSGGGTLLERLFAHLEDKELLLLLDNFEHVVTASPLAPSLLAACPRLKILVTSRVPLRVTGEHEREVPPLPTPDLGRSLDTDRLAEIPAVSLFVLRVRAVRPTFVLTEANAGAVAEVCARLDGLPLAIELASARSKLFSPAAIAARLDDRFALLTGGPRDVPPHQQTIHGAISWSHDLLDPAAQTVFRRLAVFAGGFTLDAAEAVGRAIERAGTETETASLVDGVASLVEHSLVRPMDAVDPSDDDRSRFGMLETIRAYALDRLRTGSEAPIAARAHADYYRALTEELRHEVDGPDGVATLNRLEAEHDNIRAALTWAFTNGEAETALRLAAALWKFWLVHGHVGEGRRWLEQALVLDTPATSLYRLEAMYGASGLARVQGDPARASELNQELLEGARLAGDVRLIMMALFSGGVLATYQGDVVGARDLFEEALSTPGSEAPYTEHMRAMTLSSLGLAAYRLGDAERAVACTEEALAIWQRRGDKWGLAIASSNLGDMARDRGDDQLALSSYRDSLMFYQQIGDRGSATDALVRLAALAAVHRQPERAARLLGAASALRSAAGIDLPASGHADPRPVESAAREALGAVAFDLARADGELMELAAAVEDAAQVMVPPPADPIGSSASITPYGLSARELDVLRLVVQGESDQEIANALFISRRTVTSHVSNILNKLGLSSRTAATAVAVREGLV